MGRTRGGWRAHPRREWVFTGPPANCSWPVPVDAAGVPSLASLVPLAGRTITFAGDSTMRELRQAMGWVVYDAAGQALDTVVPLPPPSAPLRLRFTEFGFVRQAMAATVLSVTCGRRETAVGRALPPRVLGLNQVPLATALANETMFARYIGDALVVGGGALLLCAHCFSYVCGALVTCALL